MTTCFHIPTRPYSPIDAHNRRAAAVGSPRYAAAASNANYNGHRVSVTWNDYRGYYIAEYYWAGRVVLARGSFEQCLRAAVEEHNRGALGSSVVVYPREGDAETIALCERTPELVPGVIERISEWWTWRHEAASEGVRDFRSPAPVLIFDWPLMEATESREAYEAALRAKYGRVYT